MATGSNYYGQLGIGSNSNQNSLVPILFPQSNLIIWNATKLFSGTTFFLVQASISTTLTFVQNNVHLNVIPIVVPVVIIVFLILIGILVVIIFVRRKKNGAIFESPYTLAEESFTPCKFLILKRKFLIFL